MQNSCVNDRAVRKYKQFSALNQNCIELVTYTCLFHALLYNLVKICGHLNDVNSLLTKLSCSRLYDSNLQIWQTFCLCVWNMIVPCIIKEQFWKCQLSNWCGLFLRGIFWNSFIIFHIAYWWFLQNLQKKSWVICKPNTYLLEPPPDPEGKGSESYIMVPHRWVMWRWAISPWHAFDKSV